MKKQQATGKPAGMKESQLMELFVEELKDIYRAEKAPTKGLTKMKKKATSADLADAIQNHLAETWGLQRQYNYWKQH